MGRAAGWVQGQASVAVASAIGDAWRNCPRCHRFAGHVYAVRGRCQYRKCRCGCNYKTIRQDAATGQVDPHTTEG